MIRTAKAEINLEALQHNLRVARKASPESRMLAVIKANAYGHGLMEVAEALEDTDALAVACEEEALALREKVSKRIVVLQGFRYTGQAALFAKQALEPVIHQKWQINALEQANLEPNSINVWLKIDTGMHRLGFPLDEVDTMISWLQNIPAIGNIILMTHLACADDRADNYSDQQIAEFHRIADKYQFQRSIANSGALLGWKDSHVEWCRPGIMMYGVSPFNDCVASELNLKPVMTLKTRLIAVNSCRRGDAIGYSGQYICPRDMKVGVAAIGYGDGYPRHAANGTPVLVDGKKASLVGRVSMDMITLDLSNHPDVKVGDEVTLWGNDLPVEVVAESAGTIAYELLCSVYGRVKYEYT